MNTKISEVENKIPNTSILVTRTIYNTKVNEVEKKIPDHAKYTTTEEFNKLTTESVAARLKQASAVKKTDFENKLISFDRKITSNKTKYLEVKKKLNTQTTKDYICLLGRIYFATNDGSKNTFVYQLSLETLELKKGKGTNFILSWKSKGVYTSKLKALYIAFLHSIKLSRYRIGVKCDKDPLAAEQINYLTKIVNVYVVCDLDAWPINPTSNLKFKNSFFGETSIVKNSDKEK